MIQMGTVANIARMWIIVITTLHEVYFVPDYLSCRLWFFFTGNLCESFSLHSTSKIFIRALVCVRRKFSMSRVTETVVRKHYAAFFMRDGVLNPYPQADTSVDKVRRFPADTFSSCIYDVNTLRF